MELGLYSFGDSSVNPSTGRYESEQVIYKNLLERIQLADQVGLSYFGLGEHHREDYPLSAPLALLAAAAATTKNIRLGSAVTVLPTEDPVRVFEQYATLDVISGGRAEITVGTGAFLESYPLFGHDTTLNQLEFTEKLELVNLLNQQNPVTWSGQFRAPLVDAQIWPRPVNGKLDAWVATGATPESSSRAATLGMPAIYSFLGNPPADNVALVEHYREQGTAAGFAPERLRVGLAGRGLISIDGKTAKETLYRHWLPSVAKVSAERGRPAPDRKLFDEQANGNGPILAGSPNEVADRIAAIWQALGHDRHILHMDIGNVPHAQVMQSIELLGTLVLPQLAKPKLLAA